jgi:hypothetical protein
LLPQTVVLCRKNRKKFPLSQLLVIKIHLPSVARADKIAKKNSVNRKSQRRFYIFQMIFS